jgi:ribosomal protein L37AE/L43A
MPKYTQENPETGIIEIDNATGKCCSCGQETRFADIDYQVWVCSTECLEKFEQPLRVAQVRSESKS